MPSGAYTQIIKFRLYYVRTHIPHPKRAGEEF